MASDINCCTLVGRLTKDVATTTTPGGMTIQKFPIANNWAKRVNDQWQNEVNYFDIVYFKDTRNALGQYLVKGQQVAVTGCIRQERWEKDGVKQSKVIFVADQIEFLGNKQSSDSNDGDYSTPTASTKTYKSKSSMPAHPEYVQVEDDIPF